VEDSKSKLLLSIIRLDQRHSPGDRPGNPFLGERLSTVDLLELTSLDEVLFLLKTFLIFFTKQGTLINRSMERHALKM
jgi:hypothetical protein